jgi:fructokinase
MALEHNIGIDLGGTKIECIVLENQKEIFRDRILTESEKGSDHILNQIHQIYQKAILFIDNQKHSLGICTPGSISPDTNLLRNSNTTCLNGLPFKKILEDKLDHSLSIENDANCFALAEAIMGAGQDHAFIFGVIMGTGCGGGFVQNKN